MKRASVVLLFAAALAGCATNARPPVVPSLEGKPRVQINKQVPPQAAPSNQREGE
ncbi:hypothetical protein [Shigella flexneri]|uniref:hypothetical protein n=1 Tax=Shigella flexneri TaxID=623 RepID=UPI003CF718B5|nr:hypothetical protein [Escherichia coli]